MMTVKEESRNQGIEGVKEGHSSCNIIGKLQSLEVIDGDDGTRLVKGIV